MPCVFVFVSSKNEIHYRIIFPLSGQIWEEESFPNGQLHGGNCQKGRKLGVVPMANSSKGKTELSLRTLHLNILNIYLFPTSLSLHITEDSPNIHLFYLPGICLYGPYFRQYQPLWDIQEKILSRQKN